MFNVDNLIVREGNDEEDKTKLRKVYDGHYKEYMFEQELKVRASEIDENFFENHKYLNNIDNHLLSISPIDGRYNDKTGNLKNFFSEFALFRYRVKIEIEYFIFLVRMEIPELSQINHEKNISNLREIYKKFTLKDCTLIKNIENETKHDVKAVEYFIGIKFEELNLQKFKSFIHFGLTSQDINNNALTLSIRDFIKKYLLNYVNWIQSRLQEKSDQWKYLVMLGHTHGQPAVPTTLGKEVNVFNHRISKPLKDLYAKEYYGKLGGATGNLNAHYAAYPTINWDDRMSDFLKKFDLIRDPITTQIDNYENLTDCFDAIKRINSVLIDLNRDIWSYISMNYLKQKVVKGEVGSSTMPHKINPINFENSEGNLMIANTLLEFMSAKLPISRLQRDLTDSTVVRNIGTIFGHIVIAYDNLLTGLDKIDVNQNFIYEDLYANYSVIVEALQTIMRKYGYNDAYDKFKHFTRTNSKITKQRVDDFIATLDVSEKCRNEMQGIAIENYIGNSVKKHNVENLF